MAKAKPRTGKPVGRPPTESETRTHKIMLRATEAEATAWAAAAAADGRALSNWIRFMVGIGMKASGLKA